MTNLEKWKNKIAEAKNGEDFIYTLEQMNDEIYEKQCYPAQEAIGCELDNCEECKARWLDMEAGEIMEKTPRDFDNIAVSSDCAEEVRRDDYESETNEFVTEDIIRLEGEEYLYGDI